MPTNSTLSFVSAMPLRMPAAVSLPHTNMADCYTVVLVQSPFLHQPHLLHDMTCRMNIVQKDMILHGRESDLPGHSAGYRTVIRMAVHKNNPRFLHTANTMPITRSSPVTFEPM